MAEPDTSIAHWASLAAPPVFVLLWASGFIGAKFGLPYAEPMTFLTIRMALVVGLLALIVLVTQPAWPTPIGMVHSAVVGLLVHGCYLGGVFYSIDHKLPAGFRRAGGEPATGADLDARQPAAGRAGGVAAMAGPRPRHRRRLSGGAGAHRGRGAADRLGRRHGRR